MKLYKLFGIDISFFEKLPKEETNRQLYIYNWLGFFIIFLALIGGFSFSIYSTIIFNKIAISIFVGIISFLIFLNLLLLIMLLTLVPQSNEAYSFWINKSDEYTKYYNVKLGNLSEEEIQREVYSKKEILRDKFIKDRFKFRKEGLGGFINLFVKVGLIIFIGLIISSGIQIFIFSTEINSTIQEFINSSIFNEDEKIWLSEMCTQNKNSKFILINSKSIILVFKVLVSGLGIWKFVIDIIFILIYALPIIIFRKSYEFNSGSYMRELVLSEYSISFYHFLKTKVFINNIKQKQANFDLSNAINKK